jgi:hypothetical protein
VILLLFVVWLAMRSGRQGKAFGKIPSWLLLEDTLTSFQFELVFGLILCYATRIE